MSRFSIGIVGRYKNKHADCFLDFAKALRDALRALGHEVCPESDPGRWIMFGSNNLIDTDNLIPLNAIIFNAEQLAAVKTPKYFLQNYIQLRQMTVWDYSQANLEVLKQLGIKNAVLCPLGYIPSMTTIKALPPQDEDIDVLHYGSVGSSPRKAILDALEEAGLHVVRLMGVYGEERDAFIARSKVVLNTHFYPNAVFEIFRVSHLLANKRCVVTEAGGVDTGLENLAKSACVYLPRNQIVDECRRLCAHAKARQFIAARGFNVFSQVSLIDNVHTALEAS